MRELEALLTVFSVDGNAERVQMSPFPLLLAAPQATLHQNTFAFLVHTRPKTRQRPRNSVLKLTCDPEIAVDMMINAKGDAGDIGYRTMVRGPYVTPPHPKEKLCNTKAG
eukprot:m.393957 g.393957  ORF g.393957 m.393957 type:complete len:110 (-) comp16766_c0_seq13:556-885(-)